jgi:molybdate transport repressor ModE-like protein
MDKIRCLQIFSEIARCGSFVATAKHLGISKATVTKQVAAFEKSLGARLINRTTKQVRLTEAGTRILRSTREILGSYDDLEMEARDSVKNPKGVLRIGAPPAFGAHHLAPLIVSFVESHPEIQIVLSLDDGSANLVIQGLDLSIRIAPSAGDSSHVALPLLKAPQVLVASPDYLKKHGTPSHPDELASHNCLIHSIKAPTGVWQFNGNNEEISVRVRGSFYSNFGEPLQFAALHGHGISMHPYYMAEEYLSDERLVAVLPEYAPSLLDICVVYSSRQNLPVRVREFLDYLKEWAKTPPKWAISNASSGAKSKPAQRRNSRSVGKR